MKISKRLYLLFTALCLIGLAGCQNKPTNREKENTMKDEDAENVENITEEENLIEEEKMTNEENQIKEDNMTNEEKHPAVEENIKVVYEATIENPESLFEKVELAKAFKAIGYHNPLISQRFGADPFAMVYNDRVFVYMTNDSQQLSYDSEGNATENTYGLIKTLNCISSDDLVNWTDHGTIKVGTPNGATSWANNSWAPAATHKIIDGKEQFFVYFANSGGGIGVLRGDSPVGPFKDPLGKALITKKTENCSDVEWLFDPAVLLDDDGRAYLYFGGGVPKGLEEMPNTARVVELGEDMISLVGTPVVIEAPYLFEDSGINKIGNTYYYTYCSNWDSRDNAVGPYVPEIAEIIYMTSDNPMGPWEYRGSILKNPGTFFETWGNNHHSMINFKDKLYIFYHTQALQDDMGIKGGYRSTHVDEVTIKEDGSIKNVKASKFGVEQISKLNPYIVTEAETMAWMGGISVKMVKEPSSLYGEINSVVHEIQTGDWIGLSDVDFGGSAPGTFTAKVASEIAGNIIRITVDKVDGECLGYLEVPNTESLEKYAEVTVNLSGVAGVHNLFFTFSGNGFLFDSWSFK
ncbi:MAG TPA: glycoside hydrolase family 43 protein [Mobilitalea sp.]|nr:glycoside hydrolase family 43 protein [Mobilitalea sp.]